MAAELTPEDDERARKNYSVYDVEAVGQMDAACLGDCLRSLGLNPTEEYIATLGGTKTAGERTLTVEEFLGLFARAQKEVYVANMEDYVGLLELYDRRGKGKIAAADLVYILQTMGEGLSKLDSDYVMRIAAPKEDSLGEISYAKFLQKFLTLESKNNPYAPQYTSAIEIVEAKKAVMEAEKAARIAAEKEAAALAKEAAAQEKAAAKAAAAAEKAAAKAAAKAKK